jgi:hypothetical protein
VGVRLDVTDGPKFIRIYPIPFKMLEVSNQFKKYQIIEVPVTPHAARDPRPESYEPDIDHFSLVDTKRKWGQRTELIKPLIAATTTCELVAKNRVGTMTEAIPSFGLIRPEIKDFVVERGPAWKAMSLEKGRQETEPTPFDEAEPGDLQPVPYRIKFRYKCQSVGCRGHIQQLIDWELAEAGMYWPMRYGGKIAEEKIAQKLSEMTDPAKKDVHFYVENQHQHRESFSICGIWSPPL